MATKKKPTRSPSRKRPSKKAPKKAAKKKKPAKKKATKKKATKKTKAAPSPPKHDRLATMLAGIEMTLRGLETLAPLVRNPANKRFYGNVHDRLLNHRERVESAIAKRD